jgi:hypothetical protein
MDTVIVISSYCDSTIREGQAGVDFLLFKTIEDLDTYIETTPVRATSLFFTKEVIPHTNTSLNYLASLLQKPFLKVDSVIYITEKNSIEIAAVKYLIEDKSFDNWEIVEGFLTREYINGIITGSLRTDTFNAKRKSVYRVPRKEYVENRLQKTTSLQERYEDDEAYLKDIPPVPLQKTEYGEYDTPCRILHITGCDCEERTAFAFLVAQYLALSNKVLIVEKDVEYHRLGEYVTKSGAKDIVHIDISDLLAEPEQTLALIKNSEQKLICAAPIARVKYSYQFVSSLLYSNLASDVNYFVEEDDFNESPLTEPITVVLPTTVVGILKTCESLDGNYLRNCKFVGVNFGHISETRVSNSNALDVLLSDILERRIVGTQIVSISSLRIGGTYDLRSIVGY